MPKQNWFGRTLMGIVSLILSAAMVLLPIILPPRPTRIVNDDVPIVEAEEESIDENRIKDIDDMEAVMEEKEKWEDEEESEEEEGVNETYFTRENDSPKKRGLRF